MVDLQIAEHDKEPLRVHLVKVWGNIQLWGQRGAYKSCILSINTDGTVALHGIWKSTGKGLGMKIKAEDGEAGPVEHYYIHE